MSDVELTSLETVLVGDIDSATKAIRTLGADRDRWRKLAERLAGSLRMESDCIHDNGEGYTLLIESTDALADFDRAAKGEE